MGDQDHHTDEYLSAVKLSILTALATWWRGCYTPHKGPEAFAAMGPRGAQRAYTSNGPRAAPTAT